MFIKDAIARPRVELLCNAGSTLVRCLVLAMVVASACLLFWESQGLVHISERQDVAEQLLVGASAGDATWCSEALQRGAPVEARSDTGCTALILAAARGDVDLATQLIDAGAAVAAVSDLGMTPLAMAAMNGHVHMIRMLIDAGAAVDQPVIRGGTALHVAASQSHHEVAQVLIQHGADVNRRNYDGSTPLMVLAYVGAADVALAATLVAAGTDLRIESIEGNTARGIAQSEGRSDLQALFLTASTSRTSPP